MHPTSPHFPLLSSIDCIKQCMTIDPLIFNLQLTSFEPYSSRLIQIISLNIYLMLIPVQSAPIPPLRLRHSREQWYWGRVLTVCSMYEEQCRLPWSSDQSQWIGRDYIVRVPVFTPTSLLFYFASSAYHEVSILPCLHLCLRARSVSMQKKPILAAFL